jgi:hypothetical protein
MWTTLCISCVKDDIFVAIRIYKESSIVEIFCQVPRILSTPCTHSAIIKIE